MPRLVSLTGKDNDFQSLSWATWGYRISDKTKSYFGGVAAVYQIQLLVLPNQAVDAIESPRGIWVRRGN
jgi:hypothetical protein